MSSRHLLAFALGFSVVFLGAGIAVQAQPYGPAEPVAMVGHEGPKLSDQEQSVDLWWLPGHGDEGQRPH